MNSMSSKERMRAAFRREEVDHVPCSPFFNPQDYVHRIGKKWQSPVGPSQEETVTYFAEERGLDPVVEVPWKRFYQRESTPEMHFDNNTLKKTWHTPAGDISAEINLDENWSHGFDIPLSSDCNVGHYVTPWIESQKDLDCLEYLMAPPETKQELEALRFTHTEAAGLAEKHGLARQISIGSGLTDGLHMFGTSGICLTSIDEPELVDRFLEIEHRNTMKNLEIALELGTDFIRRNGYYESCDFFSPDYIKKTVTERVREEAEAIHNAGALVGYTMITGYTPIVDHLRNLDVDCIVTPDPFFSGNDPAALYAACKDRCSFWTGPSDTLHMPYDNPEEVKKAVRRTFEIFGKRGLILTPCSSGKAVFPWSGMEAMISEWENLRDFH